ncbi:hypothetical protein B0H11DRAFT_2301012 [Mycena galericulata]|nr:hypothetical protein B0H11DRAFT_2301012 [Mycena galericulata]
MLATQTHIHPTRIDGSETRPQFVVERTCVAFYHLSLEESRSTRSRALMFNSAFWSSVSIAIGPAPFIIRTLFPYSGYHAAYISDLGVLVFAYSDQALLFREQVQDSVADGRI